MGGKRLEPFAHSGTDPGGQVGLYRVGHREVSVLGR
jgi:hypothetical protein